MSSLNNVHNSYIAPDDERQIWGTGEANTYKITYKYSKVYTFIINNFENVMVDCCHGIQEECDGYIIRDMTSGYDLALVVCDYSKGVLEVWQPINPKKICKAKSLDLDKTIITMIFPDGRKILMSDKQCNRNYERITSWRKIDKGTQVNKNLHLKQQINQR